MLPRLLAAYRKYGSEADRSRVCENQCCNKGAVDDTTKNGPPTATSRRNSSDGTGVRSTGGVQPAGMAIGRSSDTESSRLRLMRTCARMDRRPLRTSAYAYPARMVA